MIALHPGEQIVLQKRRYWLPIALESAALIAVAGAPFIIILFFGGFLPEGAQLFLAEFKVFALFLATALAVIVWVILFIRWTDYYLDVLFVTTKRVVDIEQIGLFGRDIAETHLENVQDVRVEIIGFLPSILDFGNIYLQTAGATKEFRIRNLSRPNEVKDLIFHQCELDREEARGAA